MWKGIGHSYSWYSLIRLPCVDNEQSTDEALKSFVCALYCLHKVPKRVYTGSTQDEMHMQVPVQHCGNDGTYLGTTMFDSSGLSCELVG